MTTTMLAPERDTDGTAYCPVCNFDLVDGKCPDCPPVTVQAAPREEAPGLGILGADWPPSLADWQPAPVPEPETAPDGSVDARGVGLLRSYATIPEQETFYVDLGEIPLKFPVGSTTLLYGDGGIGKGRMLCSLIAEITNRGGVVIVVFGEDKAGEEVKKRLRLAGAVTENVIDLTRLPSGQRFKVAAKATAKGHLGILRAVIAGLREEGRDPQLVILDPIRRVALGTVGTEAGAEYFFETLDDAADEAGVSVVAIGHTTKDGKMRGSGAMEQAARLVYKVSLDEMNPRYRLVEITKANNLRKGDAMRFEITDSDDGTCKVTWVDQEAIEAQRQAWRDNLAAKHAPTSLPAPRPAATGTWGAVRVEGYGSTSLREPLGSAHPDVASAVAACQQRAGKPLDWEAGDRPQTWTALTGAPGSYVTYAVAPARGR